MVVDRNAKFSYILECTFKKYIIMLTLFQYKEKKIKMLPTLGIFII